MLFGYYYNIEGNNLLPKFDWKDVIFIIFKILI